MKLRIDLVAVAIAYAIFLSGCGQTEQKTGTATGTAQTTSEAKAPPQAPPGYKLVKDSESGYTWQVPESYQVNVRKTDGVENHINITPGGETTKELVIRATYWFNGEDGKRLPVSSVGDAEKVGKLGASLLPLQRVRGPSGVAFDKIAYTFKDSPGFAMSSQPMEFRMDG